MKYSNKTFEKLSRNSWNYRYMLSNYSRFMNSLLCYKITKENDNIIMKMILKTSYYIESVIIFDNNYKVVKTKCSCPYNYIDSNCAHVIFAYKYGGVNDLPIGTEIPSQEELNGLDWEEYYIFKEVKDETDKKIKNLIYNLTKEELNESDDKAKIIPTFSDESITFKIGYDRLYMIKNIRNNLLNPLINREIVTFGKNLTLSMVEENFDDFSKKIISLLYKYPSEVSGAEFLINENTFDEVLSLFHDTEYNIFEKKNFSLNLMAIEKNNQYTKLTLKSSLKDKYGISKNHMYQFERKGPCSYCDITDFERRFILASSDFYIENTKVGGFLKVLNENFENIRIKDVEKYLEDLEAPKIYCDVSEDDDILIKIQSAKNNDTALLKIRSILDVLHIDELKDFELDETYVISKNKEKEAFFEKALSKLTKEADVYLSDFMKNYKKSRKLNLSVGVKIGYNLLELNFSSDEIDDNEVLDILSEYRTGKKYYKLKNGERFLIDFNQFKKIDEILKDFGFEKAIKTKTSKLKVPLFRMYQLDNIDSDAISFEKNKKIDEIFKIKPLEYNERFNDILRDYQKDGVNWLLELRSKNLAGILADDMGLGKTLQIIAYFESIRRSKACIIVTPASLLLNWVNEFKKFNSNLSILPIYGTAFEREENIKKIKNEIVITTYDYLKKDIKKYEKISFDTIIIDEAQYIKNHKTLSSNSVKEINAEYKIALTGTPIENSLSEIWSIFDFLMPGYLFNYSYFSRNYEKPIVLNNDEKVSNRLLKMVKPFILRRLKKNVLTELPDKIEENFYVDMEKEQEKIYKANAIDAVKKISELDGKDKIQVLALITKLRQISIDPRLLYDNIFGVSPKITAAIDIIKNSIENNSKVVLFSSFTKVLDLLIEECEKENISYHLLTGETSKQNRAKLVEDFETDDVPLFLISLKAGGTGLNLTSANIVIHLDPWWNISAQNQATDRTHRIGQKEIVQVFNIITKGSIEEKIQKLQEKKKELSDTFVENSDGSFASMSKEDLIELFKM